MILGVTGLIIFFPSLFEVTIKAAGGDLAHMTDMLPKKDSTKTAKDMIAFACKILDQEHPFKEEVSIWNPEYQNLGAYVFNTGKAGLKSVENADIIVYDMYNGSRIPIEESLLRHEKIENFVWQLHMGQWWGQIGKLSTFLAGVIATSLPITGFLIWWGSRKKKEKSTYYHAMIGLKNFPDDYFSVGDFIAF